MSTRAPAGFAAYARAGAITETLLRRQMRDKVDEHRDEQDSLAAYLPAVHRTDTGAPAYPPAHLRPIVEAFEDDSLGNTVIIAPPGSAKTNTAIAACGWWIGRDPNLHVGYFSNTGPQANRRSVAIRDVVRFSPAYRAIFPRVEPDFLKGWGETEWFIRREDLGDKDATLTAAGVGKEIMGARLDRVVYDDLASPRNMATAYQREKVIDWIRETAHTRVTPGGREIMIATRWHERDPVAWAIDQGWTVVEVDALTEDGGSYWPEQWPIEMLACPNDEHGYAVPDFVPTERSPERPCWAIRDETGKIIRYGKCQKRIMGTRLFNLSFRHRVQSDETSLFKYDWWRYYDRLPAALRTKSGRLRPGVVGGKFVDMAHEEGKEHDYFVVGVFAYEAPDLYIVDWHRTRVEFPDALKLCERVHNDYPGLPWYVESSPGAKPLIQIMKRRLPHVTELSTGGRSKLSRAEAASPVAEERRIHVPSRAAWVGDLVDEAARFPDAEHDDQVDVLTMAIRRLVLGRRMAFL